MRNRLTFVSFDAETIGLLGDVFAIGWSVYDNGVEIDNGLISCSPNHAKGSDEDRMWVENNCPEFKVTHISSFSLMTTFWNKFTEWKKQDYHFLADFAWPVEANLFLKIVNLDPKNRKWNGPFPLLDLATLKVALGYDPHRSLDIGGIMPDHNPLHDSQHAAKEWIYLCNKAQMV